MNNRTKQIKKVLMMLFSGILITSQCHLTWGTNHNPSQERNVWLFVGDAGAGKSTIIDYALDHELKKVKEKQIAAGEVQSIENSMQGHVEAGSDNEVVVVVGMKEGKKIAKINMGPAIGTSEPALYEYIDQSDTHGTTTIGLIDSPSFMEDEQEYLKKMATLPHLIKEKDNVQAIICVVKSDILLTSGKRRLFRKMLLNLEKFLVDAKLSMHAVHFFINQFQNIEGEGAKQQILSIIHETKNKVARYTSLQNKYGAMFDLILQYANIHIMDPLDGGESWQKAVQEIDKTCQENGALGIPSNLFSIDRYQGNDGPDNTGRRNKLVIFLISSLVVGFLGVLLFILKRRKLHNNLLIH